MKAAEPVTPWAIWPGSPTLTWFPLSDKRAPSLNGAPVNQRDPNKAQFYPKYAIITIEKRTLYRKPSDISIYITLVISKPVITWSGRHSLRVGELTADSSAMFTNMTARSPMLWSQHTPWNRPPHTWIKSHFWHQCRRRSGGGWTMLLVRSRQLGPQQRVISAGTHLLSQAVKSVDPHRENTTYVVITSG